MGRPTKLKHIQIYLTEEARDRVGEHAKNKGFRAVTEYVRQLIEDDINADSDTPVSLEIKRGKPPKSEGVASS